MNQKLTPEQIDVIERTCEWSEEDSEWNAWIGECGAMWNFENGTPKDNTMNYCPECGGKVIFQPEDKSSAG